MKFLSAEYWTGTLNCTDTDAQWWDNLQKSPKYDCIFALKFYQNKGNLRIKQSGKIYYVFVLFAQ